MTTKQFENHKNSLQDEREYIYLLLHDKKMVERWTDSGIGIECFDEEHHMLLHEILNSYDEGFTLTRKTFVEKVETLPVPKDRIRHELAFNSCYGAVAQKGDYIGLEKKIQSNQEEKRVQEALCELKIKDKSHSEIAEAFRETADKIDFKTTPSNDSLSTLLEQYIEFYKSNIGVKYIDSMHTGINKALINRSIILSHSIEDLFKNVE